MLRIAGIVVTAVLAVVAAVALIMHSADQSAVRDAKTLANALDNALIYGRARHLMQASRAGCAKILLFLPQCLYLLVYQAY
jgi:hypothetical protein